MDNIYTDKVISVNDVMGDSFIEARMLYVHRFNKLPSVSYIGDINGEKAFKKFKERFEEDIKDVQQYGWYQHKKKKFAFDQTIITMKNDVVVEFDDYYCEIFHDGSKMDFVKEIASITNRFKQRQRRQPLEINLVVQGNHGLQLRSMEIKRTKLDLNLFYEDDFKETDAVIKKRLLQNDDKGIVLLHGLPGTGKTTYLRYLVGKIKKRVLFLSPSLAKNLMNPEFIDLLINNPNTVLVIEDAENIIMDRKYHSSSAVSNLLNISDGLLADFLNVQLICTFNSSLTMVDSALLRKGRLIAKYEFGKLSVAKSKKLAAHMGVHTNIDQPMTIAEIANPHEKQETKPQVEVIGFRRQAERMN